MSDETTSREKILKKVRKALIHPSASEQQNADFNAELYQPAHDSIELVFAEELTRLNGNFIYCMDEAELTENLELLLKNTAVSCSEPVIEAFLKKAGIRIAEADHAAASVSSCEALVARTGSVVVSSQQLSGRKLPFYTDTHVVIAFASQLHYNIKDALEFLKEKYRNNLPGMITFISGPSRTADIEQTLVQGVHGAKEIYVLLVEEGI